MHIALRFWKGMHEGVETVRVYYLCKYKFDSFSSLFPLPFLCILPLHLNGQVMEILTSQTVELVPLVFTVNRQFQRTNN